MALHWPADMGTWLVEGQSVITPAFKPMDFELMWSTGAPIEGESVRFDGVDGLLEREQQETEVVHSIVYQVAGDVYPDGSPTPSLGAGFAANHDELVARFGRPSTWSGDSAATVVGRPDGVTLEGGIQPRVDPLKRLGGAIAQCVVTVKIPRGRLIPSEGGG